MEKVILFGNQSFAEANYYYLTHDSPYKVAAFTVDRSHLHGDKLFDLPVVPFDEIETAYPPDQYKIAIPLGFAMLNQTRTQKYLAAREKGYTCISYVSSHAIVWKGVTIGENTFIYEGAIIKPFTQIGSNTIIESGAMIGHHVVIADNCFIGPHVAIMGNSTIKAYSIIGANATISQGVVIGASNFIGANALIARSTNDNSAWLGGTSELLAESSQDLAPILTAN